MTSAIMLPPVCHGGMASRTARFPYTTPMPVGPKILCPENTKKSASRAWTSTFMCETDWAPSTSAQAPTRWAMAITSAIGVTVPSALETWVTETSFVRSLRRRWYSSRSSCPSSSTGITCSTAPVRVGQLLPGHDVGVVLEVGDDDLVALADVLPAPALGDEVDALGGAADEDDVVGRVCAEEPGDRGAGLLVGVGGAGGQVVRGPVDVGVLVLVEVARAGRSPGAASAWWRRCPAR